MQISVIVPTADRADAIQRLLGGLARQTLPAEQFEVIVVDDGSQPPVAPLVARFADRLRLQCLWQPRGGPAKARNRAIALARGELLLILNDDASVPPDLIARHAAAHASASEPRAWLGGFDLAPDCLTPVGRALLQNGMPFPFHQIRPVGPNPGRFFWTCNLSVRRDLVVAAGGFDESFRHPACEDVELGWRLEKRGVAVHWLPDAPCLHHHVLTARWWWRRQVMLGISIVQMWRKHRDLSMFPWLTASKFKGDVKLLEAALDQVARKDGLEPRQRAEAIDAAAETSGADRTTIEALAPALHEIDQSALRLGLLAGLREQDVDQAIAWLESAAVVAASATATDRAARREPAVTR